MAPRYHVFVKGIFDERTCVVGAKQFRVVGFIVGEQDIGQLTLRIRSSKQTEAT